MEDQHSNFIVNETPTIHPNLFGKVFLWMFMGLLATGLISWYTYSSGLFESIIYSNSFEILLIIELLVVLVFSFLFKKLPPIVVTILFFLYATVNGITFSVIFAVFEMSSIIHLLFATAVLFGIFAIYGYKTKSDLIKIGPMLTWTLVIAIIVSIINLFLGVSIIDIIVDWVVLFLFFGITAYDIQKIKILATSNVLPQDKLHIYGAMDLYLDFINIFLRLLSLFGKRK